MPVQINDGLFKLICNCLERDASGGKMSRKEILEELRQNAVVVPEGDVVVTTTEDGECVMVSRKDEDDRILSVIWEKA